jgi:hypothetical protein
MVDVLNVDCAPVGTIMLGTITDTAVSDYMPNGVRALAANDRNIMFQNLFRNYS